MQKLFNLIAELLSFVYYNATIVEISILFVVSLKRIILNRK